MTTKSITAEALRLRVEDAYANMADLASAMKGMAYLSGVLNVCDAAVAIQDAARFNTFEDRGLPRPAHTLDALTLTFVNEVLRHLAMQVAEGTVIMEQINSEDGLPPGVKSN